MMRSGLLLPVNCEALMEELKRLGEDVQAEVDTLLEKIVAFVEIPTITSHK